MTQGIAKRMSAKDINQIVSLAKRRGFIFQSSEVYGGLNSCWDYAPLGAELKLNVKKQWWRAMTKNRNILGLDSAILMHPKVWEASGHLDNFTDPLVDCKKCKHRFRADELEDMEKCSLCGGELTKPRRFNLMFKTFMGPVEDEGATVYLRPETAQGIFVNFQNVYTSMRQKLPFGIAQIGKAFRNEITPGNFIFRTREFEQMEMQFFVRPGDDDKWFETWKQTRMDYHKSLGVNSDNLRFHEHPENDLAHYAKAAFDIEYKFEDLGWQEIEGIHNRTDFDVKRHAEFSGKNMYYVDEVTKEKFYPYVIETSVGCDRSLLMYMTEAYTEDKENDRIVMKFHKKLAPVKLAILPLMKKPPLLELADKIYQDFSDNTELNIQMDITGSIGKRYRRQDEIGTPYCVTVDFDSLEDGAVTVRERDTMAQKRVSIDTLCDYIGKELRG